MNFTDRDEAALAGELGEAMKTAMRLLVGAAEAIDAQSFLDISAAHIDGCLYHGEAGLDFAERLVSEGAAVAVPTTLNVSSLDLLHPDLYRGDLDRGRAGRRLMEAYQAMGCRATWTCAPYQLAERPSLGDQVAWGESNAIVFANSVLGARTNRYGDFLDICCAITGRAPAAGLHTEEGRVATVQVDIDVDTALLDEELAYVAIGHVLGATVGTEIAVITGLDARADEDRLKALGAAAASSGAVGMFHVEGVTPEARTPGQALGGREPARRVSVGANLLVDAIVSLGPSTAGLGAVSVGTPHASIDELARVGRACAGKRALVPFYVNTSRDVLEAATALGVIEAIDEFGGTVVTDTCTYITPIMRPVDGAIMTNSGKWAFYAPANLGVEVVLGGLEDCVESAATGRVVRTGLFG